MTPQAVELATFRRYPVTWFELYGKILGKSVGELGKGRERKPRANHLQLEIGRAVTWCLETRRPVRLIVCKPRQKGCSTITVELAYVWSRLHHIHALIIGGQKSQCGNLWKILRTYGKHDRCRWGNTMKIAGETATCSNQSVIEKETAGDKDAGRSGTYHFVIVTELARWPSDGAKNAAEVLNSVLCCVPKEPDTFVIMESTANGPMGVFPETWKEARTLAEMQAGDYGNGYLKVFAPWYLFDDSRCPGKMGPAEVKALRAKLEKEDKKALLVWDRYRLEPEQIAYYHELLKAPECGGDPVKRDKEYPTTPEDGFQASSPSRFSREGLDLLEAQSLEAERTGALQYCTIEQPEGARSPMLHPCAPVDAELIVLEKPRHGLSYLIAVDNMTGESHATGEDSDTNAVVVLRDGFMDEKGRWRPPEPVASLTPNNRWDADVLADVVAKLAVLYGQCLVVPERNRGEWLIRELLKRNVHVMEKPRPKGELDSDKPSGKYGWQTDKESKPALTTELARAIRNPNAEGAGFACRFSHIIAQFRTFVRHSDGTEGALQVTKCHDDFVMALGIAMICRNQATVYAAPRVARAVDLEMARMTGQGPGRREAW